MKALLQFLSVPAAVIALCVILAVVGGIENGTVSFTTGILASGTVLIIEYGIFWAFGKKEEEKNEEKTDE